MRRTMRANVANGTACAGSCSTAELHAHGGRGGIRTHDTDNPLTPARTPKLARTKGADWISRSNQAELSAACATEVDLNHRPRPPKGNQPTTARVTNERMRTRSADRRGLRLLISSQVTDQRRPAHHD